MAKVAVAWSAFYSSFKRYIPGLEILKNPEDANKYDLIIFTGGEDVSPSRYGESEMFALGVNPARDDFEIKTLGVAHRAGVRVYGSCRGLQIINVAFGGTLHQDLGYIDIYHSSPHGLDWKIDKGRLPKVFPGNVNSLHHQGINKLGDGLSIAATHKDIPEIIYGRRILATQFHPEMMSGMDEFFKYLLMWAEVKDEEVKTSAKAAATKA